MHIQNFEAPELIVMAALGMQCHLPSGDPKDMDHIEDALMAKLM